MEVGDVGKERKGLVEGYGDDSLLVHDLFHLRDVAFGVACLQQKPLVCVE